jgi:hypothetical protein
MKKLDIHDYVQLACLGVASGVWIWIIFGGGI